MKGSSQLRQGYPFRPSGRKGARQSGALAKLRLARELDAQYAPMLWWWWRMHFLEAKRIEVALKRGQGGDAVRMAELRTPIPDDELGIFNTAFGYELTKRLPTSTNQHATEEELVSYLIQQADRGIVPFAHAETLDGSHGGPTSAMGTLEWREVDPIPQQSPFDTVEPAAGLQLSDRTSYLLAGSVLLIGCALLFLILRGGTPAGAAQAAVLAEPAGYPLGAPTTEPTAMPEARPTVDPLLPAGDASSSWSDYAPAAFDDRQLPLDEVLLPVSLEIVSDETRRVFDVTASNASAAGWDIDPQRASWLRGKVVNQPFCLPPAAASFVEQVRVGATIYVRMANGMVQRHKVYSIRDVPLHAIEVLAQSRAGVTVVGCGAPTATRTVLEARYQP